MGKGLELYESRIDRLERAAGRVTIHFSHAVIHQAKGGPGRDPATVWSQEAVLVLADAAVAAPIPRLPGRVVDGYLEADGTRHEVVPLPLGERLRGHLYLEFADGGLLDVRGREPVIALLGRPIPLEGAG